MTTNREKLAKMTNEALAEIFAVSTSTKTCKYCRYKGLNCDDLTCYNGILQWLNQEGEEDSNAR